MAISAMANLCNFVSFSLKAMIPVKVITAMVPILKVGYAITAGISPNAFNKNLAEKKLGIPNIAP